MVTAATREFFVTIAQASAGLTGLLFVAMSVARQKVAEGQLVVREVQASAALFTFTSALSISLFSLVRNNDAGYPSLCVGVIGLLFVAGGTRSILDTPVDRRQLHRQLGFGLLLLITFGFEVGCGIELIGHVRDQTAIDVLQNVLAGSLLIGIGRSWGIAGQRNSGVISSIAFLRGRKKVQ
jgi:hypothetical protein